VTTKTGGHEESTEIGGQTIQVPPENLEQQFSLLNLIASSEKSDNLGNTSIASIALIDHDTG